MSPTRAGKVARELRHFGLRAVIDAGEDAGEVTVLVYVPALGRNYRVCDEADAHYVLAEHHYRRAAAA